MSKVYLFKCDRCENFVNSPDLPEGWEQIDEHDFCDKCMEYVRLHLARYQDLLEQRG